MGDRLTLRGPDERRRWAREHDAFLAPRRAGLSVDEDLGARADAWADSRVRAYRERLPSSDEFAPVPLAYIVAHQQLQRLVSVATPDGRLPNARCTDAHASVMETSAAVDAVEAMQGLNTGGRYGTHLVLPPGWTLGTTPAGEWRVTDTGEAVDLTGPDAEGLARSAWKHWARAECCPTEGASDAGGWTEEQISEVARQLVHQWGGVLGAGYGDLHARFCVHILDGLLVDSGHWHPPTGEASPAIDDARHSMMTARAERDEAQAKLGALIGAVDGVRADLGATRPSSNHVQKVVDAHERLRAALDDAKGDAPTVTSSPTTPAPQAPDSPPVQHAVVTHVGGVPLRPNAPGWWWLWSPTSLTGREWRPQHVREYEEGLCFRYLDRRHNIDDPEKVFEWGGRCTRDAPDADP